LSGAVYYPVGLNVRGRRCVVIGVPGDREADEKAADLAAAGADVVRLFDGAAAGETDVAAAFLVVSTPQDAALSSRLRDLAARHRFLLCAIDQPEYGSVAMQAVVAAGPARIAISTGGVSPRAGGVLRAALQRALDATFVRFLARLAERRAQARERFPDDPAARRAEAVAAVDGFAARIELTYPQWFRAETGESP
jgi:precorrin-2 dehydrogenase/sirohydrochlorin ferrochelatase